MADVGEVFISYSHSDKDWLTRLVSRLPDNVVVWDETQLEPGRDWFDDLRQMIERASTIIRLLSPNYLSSAFLTNVEVAALLERRRRSGARLHAHSPDAGCAGHSPAGY